MPTATVVERTKMAVHTGEVLGRQYLHGIGWVPLNTTYGLCVDVPLLQLGTQLLVLSQKYHWGGRREGEVGEEERKEGE